MNMWPGRRAGVALWGARLQLWNAALLTSGASPWEGFHLPPQLSLRPPHPQAQSRIQPYQFTLCSLRSTEEVTLGVEGTSRDRHSSSTLGKQLPLSTGPDECLTALDKSPRRVPLRILHLRQCNISKQEESDLINALMTISYFNVINAEIAECKCTIP